MDSRTSQFKRLLNSPELEFILEAHDGLSAKIVQQSGFRGIWASGLAMSAALGVRDNNELSWTQVLELVEYMSDASTLPIMLDADTGYGNFNNVRRLVRKLEQRGVAAMCLEDKLFPKTNSFIKGEQQELAPIDEFVGKLSAAKDTQRDGDFCVVARVESLIAGMGLAETLDRAHAYSEAGADAVFIHSKKSGPEDILAFMAQWDDSCPVVICPTMYFDTTADVFEQSGVSMVIWANHMLRSSITAMRETAQSIYTDRSVASVEKEIASVREIFDLQDAAELEEAEARYLPRKPAS
jgi:phosphoenolpyruvate phosphomutase